MKRITRNQELDQKLRAAFGPDADLTDLAVYEVIAANTNALRKSSGIYKKARFTEGTLFEMAESINRESRQLLLNHNSADLPVGRAFQGQMVGENLHALVAVNTKTAPQVTADLEAGVIDQVSVSVMPRELRCSECGFDYFKDQDTLGHLFMGECDQGHVIGENGVHLRIVGVESFHEISFVGMGAVPGARVLGKSESVLQNPTIKRLAASSSGAAALLLTASFSNPKELKMDPEKLLAQLTAAIEQRAVAQAEVAPLRARAAELETQLTAATARVAELEAAAAQVAQAPSAAEFSALKDAVSDLLKRTLIATGVQEPVIPEGVNDILAQLTEKQAQLSTIIPKAPVSKAADAPAAPVIHSNAAFTLK